MKRLSVLMLLVGLFFAGVAVQAGGSCSTAKKSCYKAKKTYKKSSLKDKADAYRKYAENYKKVAAACLKKGDLKKAAYYTKLAEAKLKIAKAYDANDASALKAARKEYDNLKKGISSKKAAKCTKCIKCVGACKK